ncbi:acyl-CoA dehydrogenase family protein [Staphylococcus carnosus]|uniref:acyl-CoA dehydrogenase family protein n=1 Tax=Staphylococcus carnosus TaxID=1281 RepID=UPI00081A7109|nr:acyl-CoA dehydrogenase family protein [Staphylococcus carnosus]ANZ32717.1 acyl-CoA dehydrogenase [Staphylococcus carnosus]UTB80077.1 acyl-CoA dehydrogenase [Staphylococcus carnosus]UTB84845.1 acyl-CoA dehydrogenase [Staphylococcus carnosus]
MLESGLIHTEIQRKWLKKLQDVKEQFQSYSEKNDLESRFPYENIDWLVKEGYTKLTLPKEYGGEGATIEDMVILQSYLGSIDGATALSIGWHLSVVGQLYEHEMWDKPLLEKFAEDIKNSALINRAVSEAETGSPTRGGKPSTHAVKDGDNYILNGVKTFTSMSPALTHFLVSGYDQTSGDFGFFLVEKDTPGLSIAETWNELGMRATESHDLVLKDVRIPAENFVEVMGKGPKRPNGWILHIPSVYLGIAQAAADYAKDFAKEHSPNSLEGTIADLPTIQQSVGEMESLLLSARGFLWSTARIYNESPDAPVWNETSASKVLVMNQGLQVVDIAMRIVGAKSLDMDRPLQRYYRDMRAGLHNPPMQDAAYTNIAKSELDLF